MAFDAGELYVSIISGVDYFDATTGHYQGGFSTGVANTTGITVRPAFTSTPEPGSLALLAAMTLTGAAFLRRRRK